MKPLEQFPLTRVAILVFSVTLTACAGLSSPGTHPEPERGSDQSRGLSITNRAQVEGQDSACGDRHSASLGSDMSSRMATPGTWTEDERAPASYFYGIDFSNNNRVVLTPGSQAPAASTVSCEPHSRDAARAELTQTVFRFATQ